MITPGWNNDATSDNANAPHSVNNPTTIQVAIAGPDSGNTCETAWAFLNTPVPMTHPTRMAPANHGPRTRGNDAGDGVFMKGDDTRKTGSCLGNFEVLRVSLGETDLSHEHRSGRLVNTKNDVHRTCETDAH